MKSISIKSFYFIIISAAIIIFLIMICRLFKAENFLIINQDEALYVSGAEVFSKISSSKARTMIGENVSPIFEADWYGIAYPVIYGSIMKLIGDTTKDYVYTNLLFLLILVFLLYKDEKIDFTVKYGLIAVTLISPLSLYYSFYLMPTTLNILIAYLIIRIIIKLDNSFLNKNQADINKSIIHFLILIFVFSFIKVTYVFWVFALIPFSKNLKQLAIYSSICIISVSIGMVFMKLFNAPAYASNVANLTNIYSLNIGNLILSSFHTCYENILKIHLRETPKIFLFSYIFTIFSPLYFIYRYVKNYNPLMLGITLVCLISNFVSFFFYYLDVGNFLRLSAPLFFGLCFIVIYDTGFLKWQKIVFLIVLFLNSLIVFVDSYKSFKDRNEIIKSLKQDQFTSYRKIVDLIEKKDVTTILINRKLVVKNPIEFLLSMPYISNENNLIRYTSNMKGHPLSLHGKLKVNYIINNETIPSDSLEFVYSNKYFYFYKVPDTLLKLY